MSLPRPNDIITMDYASFGQPFVSVPAKSSIVTATMDYDFLGRPFVVNDYLLGGTLKRYNGVSWVTATLKRYSGASFVSATLKRYDGSSWLIISTS